MLAASGLLVAHAFFGNACSAAPSSGLIVREAKVDITPDEALPLGGYTARHGEDMVAGGKPLFARCVVFSRGSWREAIVSVEMLTLPHSLEKAVLARIPAGVGLFLCATHTHSAPDSQLLNDRMTFSVPGVASFRHRWLGWYADKIASAVKSALSEPGVECKGLDLCEFNADLNRGRRLGADPEQIGTVLRMDESGGRREDLLFSYPAHPVFYGAENNQTNGDWPGALSQKVEAGQAGWPMLVLTGAIGDVSPKAPGATPEEKIDTFCETVMEGAAHARFRREWGAGAPLEALEMQIKLDPPVPSPAFMQDYRVPAKLAQTMVSQFAPEHASITALRLGDFAIIGVPGEPTSHLGRRIRSAGLKLGFRSVLVVSHVNGWIGYILDPVDYSHGGYEASLSFNGPMEGEHVVDAAVIALRELREGR